MNEAQDLRHDSRLGSCGAPPQDCRLLLALWRFGAQVGTTLSLMVFAVLADRAGYGYAVVFIASAALTTNLLLITPVPETARLQAVPNHAAANS